MLHSILGCANSMIIRQRWATAHISCCTNRFRGCNYAAPARDCERARGLFTSSAALRTIFARNSLRNDVDMRACARVTAVIARWHCTHANEYVCTNTLGGDRRGATAVVGCWVRPCISARGNSLRAHNNTRNTPGPCVTSHS